MFKLHSTWICSLFRRNIWYMFNGGAGIQQIQCMRINYSLESKPWVLANFAVSRFLVVACTQAAITCWHTHTHEKHFTLPSSLLSSSFRSQVFSPVSLQNGTDPNIKYTVDKGFRVKAIRIINYPILRGVLSEM